MNRRHRIAALASVAVLGLAACGGSDGDSAGGEVLDAVTTTEAAAETSTTTSTVPAPLSGGASDPSEAEPEPEPEAPATTAEPELPPTTEAVDEPEPEAPTTTTEPEPTDASCLEGAWIIDSEQLSAYYAALAANSGGGLSLDADGVVNVAFFDGEYDYAADFGITVDVGGVGGTGDATGTVSGSYTVTDDNVIQASTLSSNLVITIVVGGVTVDGSDLGNGLINSAPINEAAFFCGSDGEGPTLMFQSGPSTDQRHPVVLQAL